MLHIVFEYKDEQSCGQWRRQECTFPTVDAAIEWYGLGSGCTYRIISVEEV